MPERNHWKPPSRRQQSGPYSARFPAVSRLQAGLALVVVLWMVAALMVMAAGVVHAVRSEVRGVAAQRELAAAWAAAEAGLVLAMRDLAAFRDKGRNVDGWRRYGVSFDQLPLQVTVVPISGLIDLNGASEPLLTELLVVAGGLPRDQATSLAQRILDWRDADNQPRPQGAEDPAYAEARSPFRTRGGPFEAPEDLIQVLGVDFDLYARLRTLITVHGRGDGRVDPNAAPLPVLRVLAGGDDDLALAYAAARDSSGVLADTTRFAPALIAARQPTSRYLLKAAVPLSNGAFAVAQRIVDTGASVHGLPWQSLWASREVEAGD